MWREEEGDFFVDERSVSYLSTEKPSCDEKKLNSFIKTLQQHINTTSSHESTIIQAFRNNKSISETISIINWKVEGKNSRRSHLLNNHHHPDKFGGSSRTRIYERRRGQDSYADVVDDDNILCRQLD
jgi:hypothetical protein